MGCHVQIFFVGAGVLISPAFFKEFKLASAPFACMATGCCRSTGKTRARVVHVIGRLANKASSSLSSGAGAAVATADLFSGVVA